MQLGHVAMGNGRNAHPPQARQNDGLQHGLVLCHGAGPLVYLGMVRKPRLKFPQHLKSPAWDQFKRSLPNSSVPVVTRSYLELIKDVEGVLSDSGAAVLKELVIWVERKIEQACTR
jgi:hypothetical protein